MIAIDNLALGGRVHVIKHPPGQGHFRAKMTLLHPENILGKDPTSRLASPSHVWTSHGDQQAQPGS